MSKAAAGAASASGTASPLAAMLVERPTFNNLLCSTKFPEFEDFAAVYINNGGAKQNAFLKLSGGELRVFLEPVGSKTSDIGIPTVQAHAVFPLQLLSAVTRDAGTLSLAFVPHTDTIFCLRTGHLREALILKDAIQLSHDLAADNHPDCFCSVVSASSGLVNPHKKWWNELEPHYTKPGFDPRRRDRNRNRGSSIAGLEMQTLERRTSAPDSVEQISINRKRRGTLVNASNVRSPEKCGFVMFTDGSKKPFCACMPVKPKRYLANLRASTIKLYDSMEMRDNDVKLAVGIQSITNISSDNGAVNIIVNASVTYILKAETEEEHREWFEIISEAYVMGGGNALALEQATGSANSALTALQLKVQRQQEWFRLAPDAQFSKISSDFYDLFEARQRDQNLESFVSLCFDVTNLAVDLAEMLGGSTSLAKAMGHLYEIVCSFLQLSMSGRNGWKKVPLKELVVFIEWFIDFEQCYQTSKVPIPVPGISEIPEFLELQQVCPCSRSGWIGVPRDDTYQEFSKRWIVLRGRYLQYKLSDKDDRAIETISVSQLSDDPCNTGNLLKLSLSPSCEADHVNVSALNEVTFKFASVEEAVIWCDEIVQLRSALQSSESYHPKKPVPTLKLKFDEDQSQLLSFIQEQYESIFTGDEDDIQGIQRCFKAVLEACKQDLDDLLGGDDCEECLKLVLSLYAKLIRSTILNWVEYNSENNFERFESEDSDPDSQLGLMSDVTNEFFETIYGYDCDVAQTHDVRFDPRVCSLIAHYVSSKVAKMEVLLLRATEDHFAEFDRDHIGKIENPIKHTVFSFIHQGFLNVRTKTQNHPTALKTFVEECISSVKRPSALQKVLKNWTSRVIDYLKQEEHGQQQQQQQQQQSQQRSQQQQTSRLPTKEECVQVLCATMNGLFESRSCIVDLVDNDEMQPLFATPDSSYVDEEHHHLWAELQDVVSSCRRVENDFKSQCELVRVKDRKPLGGFDEGGCLRLMVDKMTQDLDGHFDVVKLNNPAWLKDTTLIEDVISCIEQILSFLKTCLHDQVFRNVLRSTFLRVVHLYIGQFLKLKRPLMLQKGEEFSDQIEEATWCMCTRDKEELLSCMLRIQGVAHAKDADIAIFAPMTKISEALSEDLSFFQDTFLELQTYGASLSVAKLLLAFKTEVSEDERSLELEKLISSSIEPPPSDDEDESTSANAPPPFSAFLHEFGHFDRIDPHWKDKRDKDRQARFKAKGLVHLESQNIFRVSSAQAQKVAAETVHNVAVSAKQATQGSVNWFDSYIMKAEGLFGGGGRRKVASPVASTGSNSNDFAEIAAVSMDDLFGDDINSGDAPEDTVPQAAAVPRKKLAWSTSAKRRGSTLSQPISAQVDDPDTVSSSFAPIMELDSDASAAPVIVVDQNASTHTTPAYAHSLPGVSDHAQPDQGHIAAVGHSNDADPQAVVAKVSSESEHGEAPASKNELQQEQPAASTASFAMKFGEFTRKGISSFDSLLSSSSSPSHNHHLVRPPPADVHDSQPAAPLKAPDHVVPVIAPAKQETVSAADVVPVDSHGAAAAASPSSSGGLFGLFKESTKKLDSFLSGVSPVRPGAAANPSSHLNSTSPADESAPKDSNQASTFPKIGFGSSSSPPANLANPQTPSSSAPPSPDILPLSDPATQYSDAPRIAAAASDHMYGRTSPSTQDDDSLEVVDIDSESGAIEDIDTDTATALIRSSVQQARTSSDDSDVEDNGAGHLSAVASNRKHINPHRDAVTGNLAF